MTGDRNSDGSTSVYAVYRRDGIIEIVQDDYTHTGLFVQVEGLERVKQLIRDLELIVQHDFKHRAYQQQGTTPGGAA
jgi:hypothetical protein